MWPTQEETELVREKLGGFNHLPPNWEEITESEYYWRWAVRPAHSIYQYRQVRITDDKPYRDCSLFVHPGDFSGIGFYIEYDGQTYKPHYFQWKVCDHDYETITSRMCYREYRCRKCGYEMAVDSSG